MTISDRAAVDLLVSILQAPSPSSKEEAVAGILADAMRRNSFEASRDTIGNVLGTVGPPSGRSVLILGHMDTAPGVIPVRLQDGAIYGRGAVDAKGPLAAAVVAAGRAASNLKLRVTVAGAVQEEGPSLGARHIVNRPAPDFLIIAEPSGWDSIVLGYKGSQRFTFRLTQPSGHTAGPELPSSQRAVDFWNTLVEWCAAQRPDAADDFDRLTATLIGMRSHDNGLIDEATLQIGLRLPPGMNVPELRAQVRALRPQAEMEFAAGEPAVRGPKSGRLVASFLRSIRDAGGKPRFKVKTGTSDMNVVGPTWGCPMLAYGPGDSRLDHTPHEHIEIEDYLKGIRILTQALESLE